MNDYFALFGEQRRPWLDPDALKEKFLQFSSEVHPDRVHAASAEVKAAAQSRYTELVTAYHTLREPRDRLGHWLELEHGAKPAPLQSLPPSLQHLLFEVGQLLRGTDALREEKSRVSSPLLKVQFFERCQPAIDRLQAALKKIDEQQNARLAELKNLDAEWFGFASPQSPTDGATVPFERLEEIYHALGFLARSAAQLRERVFQLGL
ncbi:MAG: hypothetical protein HY043_08425 [Verrucomicrobia bacterium]|nr:hypothetical protein [Verrucomicrobiota bacterium]